MRLQDVYAIRRLPVITVAAVGIAVGAAVVQYVVPTAVPLLQRQSGVLETGQWWRLVTPLFVQTLGWYQVVANLVTLALVGVVAEWRCGRRHWAALFTAGTVGGQTAAYAWQEPGGGDSIAICGLAGGMVVWMLAGRADTSRQAVGVVVCYVAALTGWSFAGVRAAALAVLAAVVVLYVVPGRRVALLGAVACAVVLVTADDLHGVSLLSGMFAALVLTRYGRRHGPRAASAMQTTSTHRERATGTESAPSWIPMAPESFP